MKVCTDSLTSTDITQHLLNGFAHNHGSQMMYPLEFGGLLIFHLAPPQTLYIEF